MSNPSDFLIENGVLKQYKGPGGDVVIPEGVTSIGVFLIVKTVLLWYVSYKKTEPAREKENRHDRL